MRLMRNENDLNRPCGADNGGDVFEAVEIVMRGGAGGDRTVPLRDCRNWYQDPVEIVGRWDFRAANLKTRSL